MEKDYKQMWDKLRASINDFKRNHEKKGIGYGMIGEILGDITYKTYNFIGAEMDRIETGVAHCIQCGAVLENSDDFVCDKCYAGVEDWYKTYDWGGLLFKEYATDNDDDPDDDDK